MKAALVFGLALIGLAQAQVSRRPFLPLYPENSGASSAASSSAVTTSNSAPLGYPGSTTTTTSTSNSASSSSAAPGLTTPLYNPSLGNPYLYSYEPNSVLSSALSSATSDAIISNGLSNNALALAAANSRINSDLEFLPNTLPIINSLPSAYINSLPANYINGIPNVVSTVVDNSVSNSLANALQLLIVSNLIDSKINPTNFYYNSPEVVTSLIDPVPTFYPNVDYLSYPDVDYINNLGQLIDVVPNYLGGCNEVVTPAVIPEVVNYGFNSCNDYLNPYTPTGPYGAEVIFPSAIPAQLTCNFGYVPSAKPIVSVNVEPLPSFDCFGYGNPTIYY